MRLAFVGALVTATVLAGAAVGARAPVATLLAAGDIASCASGGDEATAMIVDRQRGTVAVLGDIAYERGTAEELAQCYAPTWGRFRGRTRAALGNHEYASPDAAPARAFFGLPQAGWYSYRLGAWHVVVLNSNCSRIGGCGRGSPQWRWLQADLAAHPARCTLAYWHHPRWSSGLHGSDATMGELWSLLAGARAEVVLAGHDHHYERFAPIDGIRSFVVGTGGRSHSPVIRRIAHSEVVNWTTYGVLRLALRRNGFDWRFLPVAGRSFTDAGSAACR
jgi:hypothetical protein